jgi:hypothetical protein
VHTKIKSEVSWLKYGPKRREGKGGWGMEKEKRKNIHVP